MIKTVQILHEELSQYSDVGGKIRRMCENGELFPLTHGSGIYETDGTVPGYCLAQIIGNPSYLSFEFALSKYNLIPESVFTFTSATYSKKKARTVTNHFGKFTYRDVPATVYPLEVKCVYENEYAYFIATPEKALCDKLYTLSPCANKTELSTLLFDDLRIDIDEFKKLNMNVLYELAPLYKNSNLKLLRSFIRKEVRL